MLMFPLIGFGAALQGEWYTIYSNATTGGLGGITGYGFRNTFPVAGYSAPPSVGTKIRITYSQDGTVGDMSVAGTYVGHKGGGDAYDFDGSQAQVTVGSSATFTVAVGTPKLSDPIPFDFDATKDLVISIGSSNDTISSKVGLTHELSYYKSGASGESGTADVTGYSSLVAKIYGISKIEVFA